MSPAPAEHVNAKELAGRAASIERSLDLRQLPRVAEAGALEGTRVRARLHFAVFEGRPTVDVQLEGVLVLVCQRCLKPCECGIEEVEPVIVVAADGDDVPGGYAPFIGEAQSLPLTELIEEQVLLGLPLVPMHENESLCREAASEMIAAEAQAAAKTQDKQTPFAKLRELLDQSER